MGRTIPSFRMALAMEQRLDSFEQAEQSRKEHEAERDQWMQRILSTMDSMIVKMYEVNQLMPSLPTKELQDTFQLIIGKKDDDKKKKD